METTHNRQGKTDQLIRSNHRVVIVKVNSRRVKITTAPTRSNSKEAAQDNNRQIRNRDNNKPVHNKEVAAAVVVEVADHLRLRREEAVVRVAEVRGLVVDN